MHFPLSIVPVKFLTNSNYKKWKSDIELNLGMLDYDHVLTKDPPIPLAEDASTEAKERFERWYKHNKMTLIMIKKSLPSSVRGSIPDVELAKVYFKSIADKYKPSNKAETGTLMKALMRMEFDGKWSIREYIMKGADIVQNLKDLGMNVEEPFLVYMLLNSLPDAYGQLKSLYKIQQEKWTVGELISLCVEVEDEIKKKGKAIAVDVDVNLVMKPQHKRKQYGHKKGKPGTSNNTSKVNKSDSLIIPKISL